MEDFESRDDVIRAGNHFYRHILKYEIIASLAIASGIVMNLLDKPGRILVTGSLLMLAIIYFFVAFSTITNQQEAKFEKFVLRVNSWISSIALIGLIFLLHRLPLANTIALIGAIPLMLMVLLMLLIKNRKSDSQMINFITIIRSLIISIAVLIYYLLRM